MAKAETNLGVEILQQAIASGHAQRAQRDRSISSFTNAEAQFAAASNIASHNHHEHSGSTSVNFIDPSTIPFVQPGWNQYYPPTHPAGGTQQVKPPPALCLDDTY